MVKVDLSHIYIYIPTVYSTALYTLLTPFNVWNTQSTTVMHRLLTICVQYSISSKMGVVHFRPQHFCLGPCRVDRFVQHLH